MFEEGANEEEFEREQAERREYVKNIGIEYRFGCYEVFFGFLFFFFFCNWGT